MGLDVVEKNKKEAQELLRKIENLNDSEKDVAIALINGFLSGVNMSKSDVQEKESA